MKKGLIIMSLLATLLALTGCKTVKTNYQLEHFHYGYYTSWRSGDYTMNIEKIDGQYIFTYQQTCEKYGPGQRVLTTEDISKIEAICKKYKVNKWNGFNKSNMQVLDGNSFSIDFTFTDASVEASGYMSYPKDYRSFMKELDEILNPYISSIQKELQEAYRNQSFDGELEEFSFRVSSPTGKPKYEYYFLLYANDDSTVDVRYNLNALENNEDGLPAGSHSKNSEAATNTEILNRLNAVVKKYHLQQYDAIRPSQIDDEYVSINVHYNDDKHLEIINISYLEDWPNIRQEFLDLLKEFVQH